MILIFSKKKKKRKWNYFVLPLNIAYKVIRTTKIHAIDKIDYVRSLYIYADKINAEKNKRN